MSFKDTLSENAPKLFVYGGLAGVFAAGIGACFVTAKVIKVVNDAKDKLDTLEKYKESDDREEEYTEENYKRDAREIKAATWIKILSYYAIPFGVASLSACSVFNGVGLLNDRLAIESGKAAAGLAACGAAYDTIDRIKNRAKEVCSEKDAKYICEGVKSVEMDLKTEDDSGNETTKKVVLDLYTDEYIKDYLEHGTDDPYHIIFGPWSSHWNRSNDANKAFIGAAQSACDSVFISRGREPMFLNEMRNEFGECGVPIGQLVGCCKQSDNYVLGESVAPDVISSKIPWEYDDEEAEEITIYHIYFKSHGDVAKYLKAPIISVSRKNRR